MAVIEIMYHFKNERRGDARGTVLLKAEREREQRRNKQYIRAKAVFFCPFRLHWINPFHKKSVRLCRTDFLW